VRRLAHELNDNIKRFIGMVNEDVLGSDRDETPKSRMRSGNRGVNGWNSKSGRSEVTSRRQSDRPIIPSSTARSPALAWISPLTNSRSRSGVPAENIRRMIRPRRRRFSADSNISTRS
jgi:hypothetical protein